MDVWLLSNNFDLNFNEITFNWKLFLESYKIDGTDY